MKSLYAVPALVFLMLYGCSNITFERKVDNNIFISRAEPRLEVQVSPQFKYIGLVSTSRHHQNVRGSRGLLVNYNSYLFVDIGDDNIVRRGVVIRVDKINKSYWDSDIFSDVKNRLISDYEDIHSDRYEHFVAVRSDIFTEDEMKFVVSEGMKDAKPVMRNEKLTYSGYSLPKCFMVDGLGTRAGSGLDTRVCIYYFEDLRFIDEGSSCKDLIKGDMPPEESERVRNIFQDSRKKAVTFIKIKD